MNLFTYLFIVACVALVLFIVARFLPKLPPSAANPEMICPHCQTKGTVIAERRERTAGVSGGKATAAILTGGLSMLSTGLSRMTIVTACRCRNCGSEWTF